jgi:hypothetical protein
VLGSVCVYVYIYLCVSCVCVCVECVRHSVCLEHLNLIELNAKQKKNARRKIENCQNNELASNLLHLPSFFSFQAVIAKKTLVDKRFLF